MSEIPSPCIKICFRDSNGICFGCRRTGEEIGNWSKFTDAEKKEVLKKILNRMNVPGETPPGNFLR
jgi:uncharacterized protein